MGTSIHVRCGRVALLFTLALFNRGVSAATGVNLVQKDTSTSPTYKVQSSSPTVYTNQGASEPLSSLIICAVDGSVYTVDAFSGAERGHFSTEIPLVTASGAEDWDERIVPGLDGRLYSLKAGPELKPLPLTVMDIIDNPVRTCREGGRDCGIVTGIKTTSLYAFDPVTGVLQWEESSSSSRNKKRKQAGGERRYEKAVVLQREDFLVRHISAQDGEALWNVSVGHYLALNFDGPSHPKLQTDPAQKLLGGRRERFEADVPPTPTKLPSIAFDEEGNSVIAIDELTGTILWRRRVNSVVASVYAVGDDGWAPLRVLDDQEFEKISQQALSPKGDTVSLPPSSSTDQALMLPGNQRKRRKREKRHTESFWNGAFFQSYFRTHIETNDSGTSGALVLYEPPDVKGLLQWKAKLNRHESAVFVQSSTSSQDSCVLSTDGSCGPQGLYSDEYYLGRKQTNQKMLPSPEGPPTIYLTEPSMPSPHGGLFLSWPLVMAIVACLVAVSVALRILYLRKKKKWVSLARTPPLLPTNPNSGEEEEQLLLRDSAKFLLGGDLRSETTLPLHSNHTADHLGPLSSASGTSQKNRNRKIITRTMSLPMLHDGEAVGLELPYSLRSTVSDKSTDEDEPPVEVTVKVTKGTAETAALSSQVATSSATPANEPFVGVGLIDGVPLVRYSRYRSEFQEIAALGKGGFGTVFQCSNTLDGREYAVKKVRIRSFTEASGNATKEFSQRLQRVLREVKILALLDHPNIVRYYTAWLEMEEGGAADEGSTAEYGTTTGKRMTRCFSSELVAGGKGGPSASESQQVFTSGRSRAVRSGQHVSSPAKRTACSKQKSKYSFNPLGINNFLGEDSFDSFRKRRSVTEEDDIGFTFERSNSDLDSEKKAERRVSAEDGLPAIHDEGESVRGVSFALGRQAEHTQQGPAAKSDSGNDSSSVSSSSGFSGEESQSSAWSSDDTTQEKKGATEKKTETSPSGARKTGAGSQSREQDPPKSEVRHTLYIQMQLCSQKSLADFLTNPEARKGGKMPPDKDGVDIPYALGIFNQIVKGVKHVHHQGLIHRDLKPSNCFIDDDGVVKVGDFGLSRESTAGITKESREDDEAEPIRGALGGDDDNTAGVGTRSYASPEQMSGSDYDASTDVYSLGIMLFELCYPMYTSMERHIVFDGLRKGVFPDSWNEKVALSFPSLQSLLVTMLSSNPEKRPSASVVAHSIESLLGEYTVLSLDLSRYLVENFVLLRVEALAKEGVLARTQQLMKDAAPNLKVLEYGLRGQGAKTIMEFALSSTDSDGESVKGTEESSLDDIIQNLNLCDEIIMVRQVSQNRN